ncbi:MAG: Plug domain-containing protein, partial [Sulfurovaceae bacterium]
MKKIVLSVVVAGVLAQNIHGEAFDLGRINVIDSLDDNRSGNGSFEETITASSIQKSNALTVSEALDTMSGVTQQEQGGRAESTLYVRGFDAKRV